jgi:hypothetical protein
MTVLRLNCLYLFVIHIKLIFIHILSYYGKLVIHDSSFKWMFCQKKACLVVDENKKLEILDSLSKTF